MTDNTLEILIKLGVIGQEDAEAVVGLLDDTKKGVDDLAKDMGVVNVSTADVEKILAKTGDTVKDTAGKIEGHNTSAREMHRVFGALNHIVPGLGTVLKAAFHPDMIGIVGSILAFEALKSVLDDIKAIDAIKLANFTGDKEAIDAVKVSYENSRVAARAFLDEQKRLNGAGLTADEVAKRQIENYKNLASAQEQYNTASKNLGYTQIDENENNDVITHQQALEQKFALDVEYAKKKLQLEAQTAAAELAAKQQQLATEKAQLSAAKGDQGTDEANAATTAAAKVKHDSRKGIAQKNIEDAQKTLDELAKPKGNLVSGEVNEETASQLEQFYTKHIGDSTGKSHSEMFSELSNARSGAAGFNSVNGDMALQYFMAHTIGNQTGAPEFAKYDGAKQQLAGAQTEFKKLEETQFKVDSNAERGKKQQDATYEAVRTLSASVAKHAVEISQMKADAAAKLNNNAATQNLDLRDAAIKAHLPDPGNIFKATAGVATSAATATMDNPTPWRYDFNKPPPAAPRPPIEQARADFNAADHAKDILQSGGKLANNEAEYIRHIAEVMSGQSVKSDQVLATLKALMTTQNNRDEAFQRELANLTSQNLYRH